MKEFQIGESFLKTTTTTRHSDIQISDGNFSKCRFLFFAKMKLELAIRHLHFEFFLLVVGLMAIKPMQNFFNP